MCSIVMLVEKGSISAIPISSLVKKWITSVSACSRGSRGEVVHERLGLLLDGKRILVNYLNPVLNSEEEGWKVHFIFFAGRVTHLRSVLYLWWVTCFLVLRAF